MSDGSFAQFVNLFIDILDLHIDENYKDINIVDNPIQFKNDIKQNIQEVFSNIIKTQNKIDEIYTYLTTISFGKFMENYIKYKSGHILIINNIYKYIHKNDQFYLLNYKKHKISINEQFKDKYNLTAGKMYIVDNNPILTIKPLVDVIIDYTINFKTNQVELHNFSKNNIFWFVFYFFEKYQPHEIYIQIKKKIYDIQLAYNDINQVHVNTMSNLVDMLGNMPFQFIRIK